MHPGEVLSAERLADAVWRASRRPPGTRSCRAAWSGCARLSAPRPSRRRRRATGWPSPPTRSTASGSSGGRRAARAARARRARAGRVHAPARRWRCGAADRSSSSRTGSRADRGADRLDELRRDAEELWLEAALRAGHHREVLAEAQAWSRGAAAGAPLGAAGAGAVPGRRQGEALRTILHGCGRVLVDELGLDPGPEWSRWSRRSCARTPRCSSRLRCPSPSACARTAAWCRTTWATPRRSSAATRTWRVPATGCATVGVLAVVGPSGSGKSSLVRAGVAAALRRDGRAVVDRHPGRHPAGRADGAARTVAPLGPGGRPVRGGRSRCARTPPSSDAFLDRARATHADTRTAGPRAPRRPPRRRLGTPRVRPAGRAGAVPAGRDGGRRPAGGDRGTGPAGRPACSSRGWSTCWSARSRASRARCRCCPTPCARPGSAARAGHLTVAGYQASGGHPGGGRPVGRGRLRQGRRGSRARALRDLLLRLVTPGAGRRAGAQPGPAATGRQRPGARPRSIDLLVARPAGHQRRRRRRARPRGAGPGLAATRGLARGRRRGPAHPAPPHRRRRRVGRAGPARQRALPRRPPRPGARMA